MAKVIGHTPSWLSHPSPGARIFSDPEAQPPSSPIKGSSSSRSLARVNEVASTTAIRKTIARRGTEVFTVVGNKIRWADLARVKEDWDDSTAGSTVGGQATTTSYRSFKTPVYYQITALSVSPSGHFLAISTEHTVHIAQLPHSSRLHDGDHSEIKLKTYQLGPTTHVIPEARLASVLWHPLAASTPSSDCLITVTEEAAVRLWEFERTNHWSFERPALAIDLRKLADGTSSDQDFEPLSFGKNRGFSADTFDMMLASATWGGRAADHEDPWAAMTLWTAMTNGDVYALCPLLPSQWRPSSTTVAALTTSVVSSMTNMATEDLGPDERRAAEQCYEWVHELDDEDLDSGLADANIRSRPKNPSIIPRLQGPFELPADADADMDADVVDILVIPANLDEAGIFSGEDDFEILTSAKSLPFTIVCLANTQNELHVMVELDGVTGQWLPNIGRSHFSMPAWDGGEFVLLETLQFDQQTSHPNSTLSIDASNPYRFFLTTANAVNSLSLEDWAARVASEVTDDLHEQVDSGLATRLKLACQGEICVQTSLLVPPKNEATKEPFVSAVLFDETSLGSLLLTSLNGRAVAAVLDQAVPHNAQLLPIQQSFSASIQSPFRNSQSLMQILRPDTERHPEFLPTRAPYAPSSVFYKDQAAALSELRSNIPIHRRSILTDKPFRLSPACLDIMALAHRTFSHQTSEIETAAAELFRRCERLQKDLAHQVEQMADLAQTLNKVRTGNDVEEEDKEVKEQPIMTHSEKLDARIDGAKARQIALFNRYERVRRKAGQVGRAKKDLSIKERAWIQEIDSLAKHVESKSENDDTLSSRITTSRALATDLTDQAKRLQATTTTESNEDNPAPEGKTRVRLGAGSTGMTRHRREKLREIEEMVERGTAVIEAVQNRLERLSVGV